MPTAYLTHPSCLKHDMGPYHPECPDRLNAIGDRMIAWGIDGHLVHHTPTAATREQILRVHGAAYVDEIEAASPREGLVYLDPDTALNPHSVDAAKHAAGAVVMATDLVMAGSVDNAFCAVRPPGHHAERRRAMGFCIFNSVAIGAMHALEHHGLERVAVVDFDVHHGNGTEDAFSDDPRVLMASIFQYPLYPYSGVDNPAPNMVNVPLPEGTGSDGFRHAVQHKWLPALEAFRPQMIFVSAGFDAHRDDPLAGLRFVDADYAWVTRELCAVARKHADGRLVSTLEGGYALPALGRSVAEHVKALLES